MLKANPPEGLTISGTATRATSQQASIRVELADRAIDASDASDPASPTEACLSTSLVDTTAPDNNHHGFGQNLDVLP